MGITNTRLSAVKRGIAVELALHIERLLQTPVCIVGADPTDRDVERRTPALVASGGTTLRRHLRNGPHDLEAILLPDRRLCVMSLSDRVVVEKVMPELLAEFAS